MWHISYTLNNNLIHSQKRDKVIMPAVNFTSLLQFVNKLFADFLKVVNNLQQACG